MSQEFDPQALLAQALEMQQRLMDAQAEAEESTVEGSAGGGKVRVTMTGAGEVTAVHIDPSVVDPADVEMLEDLIVASFRDATTRVGLLAEQRLGAGLFGGAGGLGDLLGGSGLFGALDAASAPAADESEEQG